MKRREEKKRAVSEEEEEKKKDEDEGKLNNVKPNQSNLLLLFLWLVNSSVSY